MPYTIKGKCIYKKDTGKKVGCTKGSVKKYMAALHSNIKESMMKKFNDISNILRESEEDLSKMTQEERDKRHRMMRRMAGLGMLAGAGVTAGELMLHKNSRAALLKAMQQKAKLGRKLKDVGKQVWKPMALGMGADLVIEPTNTSIAQHMEDKYQERNKKED